MKRKKKKSIAKRIISLALLVIVIAAFVLIFKNADSIFGTGKVLSDTDDEFPFAYETGSAQTFALSGNGLATVTTSTAQLFSADGKSVAKQIHSFQTPAVCASEKGAIFFDIGAKNCYMISAAGEITDIEVIGNVITASMNASGYFTVITEKAGHKALVAVYDSSCKKLYEWQSGTGYAVKADVSPDNRSLAVLCLTAQGSEIHIFSLSSDIEKASFEYHGDLLFDLKYLYSGAICAIGGSGLYFLNSNGEETGEFGFDGKYMCDYTLSGSDFAVVNLSEYRNGTNSAIYAVSSSGEVLGEIAATKDVTSLDANEKRILVMTTAGIYLYNRTMELQNSDEELMAVTKAFIRPKGDVMLASSFSAEIYEFKR